MRKTNHKLAIIILVFLVILYFIYLEFDFGSRFQKNKLAVALIIVFLYYFFSYFSRKRQRGDRSYMLEVVVCAAGWLVYFLLLNQFPEQKFLMFAYGFQIFFSIYLGLVFFAKFMLKIAGEEDRF